ncbi:MAG: N(5)-(carboxyethyl)ornithine synthase [Faecousia sp.]
MKTIGFPIGHKENEHRRALIPSDVQTLRHACQLFFESGYGDVLGYCDQDYIDAGANIAARDVVLQKDIICDPKVGDAEYLDCLHNQTVFGWVHAVQNREITDVLLAGKMTAYAWEDMFEMGRHCFWRNNEVAGEAAVLHAFQCYAMMPYHAKVALIGRGNVGSGALRILTLLGADVTVFTRHTEALFRKELPQFDVVVNAVLWDVARKDHLIYRDDLKRMKPGAMIIDVSCDRCGGIETSVPTTIDNPVYTVDGIVHYVVDHTPALFYKTVSIDISREVAKHIDSLVEETPNAVLQGALPIRDGVILDRRIIDFQKR